MALPRPYFSAICERGKWRRSRCQSRCRSLIEKRVFSLRRGSQGVGSHLLGLCTVLCEHSLAILHPHSRHLGSSGALEVLRRVRHSKILLASHLSLRLLWLLLRLCWWHIHRLPRITPMVRSNASLRWVWRMSRWMTDSLLRLLSIRAKAKIVLHCDERSAKLISNSL